MSVELTWNGDEIIRNVNAGTVKALIRSANLVQATAKLLVPVDTGNLRGSIVKNVYSNKLEATVSTNSEYASYVEFGLRSNSNYPVQPYMRPALKDNQEKINKIFIEEESKAID